MPTRRPGTTGDVPEAPVVAAVPARRVEDALRVRQHRAWEVAEAWNGGVERA